MSQLTTGIAKSSPPPGDELPITGARRVMLTTAVMMGSISTALASTVVNVALPDIMGALGMSQDQLQWMSTGFLAAMTASMLLAAWFVARVGLRSTFCGAVILFIFASVIAGLSSTHTELIMMRIVQGAAAGILGF